nr:MAG TPA: hypothetical protein [Caudoviricetes sp.]
MSAVLGHQPHVVGQIIDSRKGCVWQLLAWLC